MKKIIISFIFILICQILAQDTSYVKYLPLKVGNTWVYSNGGWGSGKARISITNTTTANGHVYFVLSFRGDSCHCAQGPFTPFLINLDPVRIDSATGNVLQLGSSCQWQNGEHLIDSLPTKTGIFTGNACNQTVCWDTTMQNVFGYQVKSRFVGLGIMTYYSMRRYAYGFGIINSSKGCFYSGCGFTLLGCVLNGVLYGDTNMIVGIKQISSEVPESFSLSQNYPNPFNPNTKIKFDIPSDVKRETSNVKLVVYDATGREIETLVNEQLKPDTYEVDWDGTNSPSGVYFYRLEAGDYVKTNKMVLIK